jgi:hypothetical protein
LSNAPCQAPRRRAIWLAIAATLLAGCVRQGDFGRMEPSSINRYLGHDVYAQVPGFASPVSTQVPLSADETELRAHAYTLAFIYAHTQTHDHWAEPNRFVTTAFSHDHYPDPALYADGLAKAGFRAPEARMNAIVDDMRADLVGIDAFERDALNVLAADAARVADLERLTTTERAAHGVAVRIAENRDVIEQTLVALALKIAGYELALGDAIAAGGHGVRAGAGLELENVNRRYARLEADLRASEARHAMNLPREPACLEPSLARPC